MKKFLTTSAMVVVSSISISIAAQAADLPIKTASSLLSPVPEATGYVELYGGWATTRETINATSCDPTLDPACTSFNATQSVNGAVLGGAARGNYWASHNVSLQLDVQAEATSYTLPFGGSSSSSTVSGQDWLAGGHVNWRDPNLGLLGAFAGIGDTSGVRHAVFGAEGQAYWNQYTFYLQGGYDTTTHNVSASSCVIACSFDAWFIRATGRYYFTPNLRLEGTGMYLNGSATPAISVSSSDTTFTFSENFHGWLWEAKAEWKMDNNPFAFFFKYRGSQTDYNLAFAVDTSSGAANLKMTDNRFLVGARMYFGEKTLQWNDRQGATLDIISPLAVQSGPLYFPSTNSGGGVVIVP